MKQKDGYESVTVSELIFGDNYEIDHIGKQIKTATQQTLDNHPQLWYSIKK